MRAPQESQRGDVPPTLALAVALLAWPLFSGNLWRRWLASHAMLLLAIAGIIWYLAAPLPWLGWLAVLGAGWLALRTPARIAAT